MAQKVFLKKNDDTFWVYDVRTTHMVSAALPRKKDEERIQRRPPQKEKVAAQRIRRKTLLKSNLADNRTDAWQAEGNGRTVNGKINYGMTGSGTSLCSKKKGKKGRRAKEKASLADALLRAVPQLPQRFYEPFELFLHGHTEEQTSFIAQSLTPTSMVLDLGCARAMASEWLRRTL